MKRNAIIKCCILDMKRAFFSWKSIAGIIGVFLMMLLASMESRQWQLSVLNSFSYVVYSMPFLLTLIFTTFVYGQSFCEDTVYHYSRLIIIRTDLKTYVFSKILSIMVSSIAVMTGGMLLFVLALRLNYPWIDLMEGTYETLVDSGSFRGLLEQRQFFLYYLFCGIQYGIYAGILAIAAAMFSLLYHDTLFVLSVPLVLRYCIDYFSSAISRDARWNLAKIYDISYNVWDNDVLSFLYACLVAVLLSTALGYAIYRILKRQGV